MPGIRTSTISLLLLAPALWGQSVWLPLDVGNQWVYRSSGPGAPGSFLVVVDQTGQFGGKTYSLVKGFPSQPQVWLRNGDDGRIYMYDTAQNADRLWLDTMGAAGETSPTGVYPCNSTSTVVSRNATYSGPLGEWPGMLEIRYDAGSCADAGLTSDIWMAWVGILQRSWQTIAGPRSFNLVYAKLGAATVISAGEVSFSVAVDRPAYVADLMPPVDPARAIPYMTARLTLRNTQTMPITLEYASSQTYEIMIWNDQGKVIWRWSDGKVFLPAMRTETLAQGEKNWVETFALATSATQPLPVGRYVLEATLMTATGRNYTATVPFRVEATY
jgi:hypothetical protein